MRRLIPLLVIAFSPLAASAQAFKMEPPKSPEESLRCIKMRPGFKAELMIAEPLVKSPIAFAWGADGKFWVVEMGDYPLGIDGKGKPGGRIKFLEKTRPDGPYDKMTVFMDGLGFPTGVLPFGKGVLVTCAPDIFYAEDTDGDGKADKKEVLFTGFVEGNQQHRANGLTWGIDNWIYGANGDSGGKVKSMKTGKVVDIRGRDFRLKVETGEFEAQTGQSQFGRCRDDWGNWFGNNNSNPMYHYVLEDQFLKRNPHVLYPETKVQVSIKPGASEVFPISKPLPRFNSPDALNHFTSACSTIIYRDTLFGPAFEGNSFVSEPVHNLIHREIVKIKGVTFTSQRADDEQTSEFLASSDNWFRPTMIQVGPDGALWVADMYRYVIEHPQWIPKDWQAKLDLRAGQDLGRIYRVYPVAKKPHAIVRMDTMSVKELAKKLESPNGPTRDMAHRLLVELKDSEEAMKDVKNAIPKVLRESKVPQARLHALSVLEALSILEPAEFTVAVKDPHPGVRKLALRIFAEGKEGYFPPGEKERFLKEGDPPTRLEYGYTLSSWGTQESATLLARYLIENANDRYYLAAGLSSISEKTWKTLSAELLKEKALPAALIGPTVRMARVFAQPGEAQKLLTRHLHVLKSLPAAEQMSGVADLVEYSFKNDTPLEKLLNEDEREAALGQIKGLYTDAVKIVADPKAALSEKLIALRLLSRGLGDDRADQKLLVGMLTPRSPDDVQSAVIGQIAGKMDPRVPGVLLAPWKGYSPALRGQVLDALLSRPVWTALTVQALQNKQIPANEIDAIRRQRLLHNKDQAVRVASAKIFASASNTDRGRVVDQYWLQLPDKGDVARGVKLFTKSCATCHQLSGVGQQIGPDLASVGDKSPQGLLIAILDPNRAVEARYINYVAVTKAGLTHNGILASESSTSITLVGPDGKQQQLLRNELEELASTGKSMMPDGLEKDLSPQDLADIIEFVRTNLPAKKRKEFPGNEPATVRMDKKGEFHLTPKEAQIFGPFLIIEKEHGNLGWWTDPGDHVVWTIQIPADGKYAVWIDYACSNDSAGNTLVVRSGASHLLYKTDGTGSWDDYRARKIGMIQLSAGTQEIAIRSEGTLRGSLIDLKKVTLVPQ